MRFASAVKLTKMSRVYIGRLSYRAREKDVERFFKGYGKILEVDLKNGYGEIDPLFVSGSSLCKQAAPPCGAVVGALLGAAVAAYSSWRR